MLLRKIIKFIYYGENQMSKNDNKPRWLQDIPKPNYIGKEIPPTKEDLELREKFKKDVESGKIDNWIED